VLDGGGEGEALDALGAPLGGDFVAGRAPDFFGVALEEGEVEFAAEAVDEEVFKTFFGLDLVDARPDVAGADAGHAHQAEVRDGVGGEGDGIVEKLAQIIDTAAAGADEHDQVGVGRLAHGEGLGDGHGSGKVNIRGRVLLGLGFLVVSVGEQRTEAAQRGLLREVRGDGNDAGLALVADGYGCGFAAGGGRGVGTGAGCVGRHQVHPPLHDAVGLGEEAVAADVHTVALVANGAGDAADLVAGLEDDGDNIRTAEEFETGGETCGAGAYDDCELCHST
jgi:hypothetical protein